jgi:hypothetical protein
VNINRYLRLLFLAAPEGLFVVHPGGVNSVFALDGGEDPVCVQDGEPVLSEGTHHITTVN